MDESKKVAPEDWPVTLDRAINPARHVKALEDRVAALEARVAELEQHKAELTAATELAAAIRDWMAEYRAAREVKP